MTAVCKVCGAPIAFLWERTWVHAGPIPTTIEPHRAVPSVR